MALEKNNMFYCDCEAPCIHKGEIKKVSVYEKGKMKRLKAVSCKNIEKWSSCHYRKDIIRAFKF